MNNVVLLRKRNVWQKLAESVRQNLDPAFCAGVTAAFVLPGAICSSYFGFPFAIALGGCAGMGTISGIIAYRRYPYRIVICIPSIVSQTRDSREHPLRLAA
jgi:hypothetical protein